MAFALFPFVGPGHPFFARVEEFRALIAAHPRLARVAGGDHAGRTAVHAEIKAVPDAAAGWQIDRFYWSLQRWDRAVARPFSAITLYWSAKNRRARWHEFPDDPYLATMAGFWQRARGEDAAEVLRYVPLRRLTFRARDATGTAAIGKFKRRSRFREAYELLGTVADAVERVAPGFAVARRLAIDEERCLYYQTALPGHNLADSLCEDGTEGLLARAGGLLERLHRLPAARLPQRDRGTAFDELRRDVRWIGLFEPTEAGPMADVLALLERLAPRVLALPTVFCHGDFVCSQILAGEEGWAVTDFDLAHQGDAYRDIAILLASLPYDVPRFQDSGSGAIDAHRLEAAEKAILSGYEQSAGDSLDPLRLAWHRAAAEIYYLALMFKKDQFSRAAADCRLAAIRRLRQQIEGYAP